MKRPSDSRLWHHARGFNELVMQVLFCLACQRRVRVFNVDVRARKRLYQNTDVGLQNAWIAETRTKLDSAC